MIKSDPAMEAAIEAVVKAHAARGQSAVLGRSVTHAGSVGDAAWLHLRAVIAHLPSDEREMVLWYAQVASELALKARAAR